MVCAQCGHDNPSTAKYCNECGGLIDRRKGERRQGDRRTASARSVAPQEGAASRRPAPLPSITPGQENAQGRTAAGRAAEAYLRKEPPFRGPEQMPVEDARESGAPLRPSTIVTSRGDSLEADRISGPSFLGLAGSASTDDRADYLLDEQPRNGWRKWAVLVILIIIGLLVYMQWQTNWRAKQHDELLTPPPERGGEAPSQHQPPTPQPSSLQPASPANGSQPAQPQPANKPASESASADKPHQPPEKPSDAASSPDDSSDTSAEEAEAKPAPHTQNAKGRASVAPVAERGPDPMVQKAQKYLYGVGVPQSCDQAMLYLRAATEKPSIPARSQMGALYATGTCVPQDRVRAYQWFTAAYQLDPKSAPLQQQRLRLWAQMSADERQRALR